MPKMDIADFQIESTSAPHINADWVAAGKVTWTLTYDDGETFSVTTDFHHAPNRQEAIWQAAGRLSELATVLQQMAKRYGKP